MKNLVLSLVFLSSLFLPGLSFAQSELEPGGLIVCDGVKNADGSGNECDFGDFILLISKLIRAGIVLSTFLVMGLLIWTGFQYITSFAKPVEKGKARKRFMNILIGYACILLAWVVVGTIMDILVKDGTYFEFITF